MSIVAWRIVKARLAAHAFSGDGARRFGGRWNSKGTPVDYAAGSQALAVLEMLVHLDAAELLKSYRLISVTFDESIMKVLPAADLPLHWRRRPTPAAVRAVGDRWIASRESVVLQVPSVVVPAEPNFLLNVTHPEFKKILIGRPQSYQFDRRLLK